MVQHDRRHQAPWDPRPGRQRGRHGPPDLTQPVGPHLGNLPEAGPQQGQEDAGDTDMVARLHQPRVLTLHSHADGAREVPHWHLVALPTVEKQRSARGGGSPHPLPHRHLWGPSFTHMLLHLELLVLDELRATALEVQTPARAVRLALAAGAHDQRHEGWSLDLGEKKTACQWEGQIQPRTGSETCHDP